MSLTKMVADRFESVRADMITRTEESLLYSEREIDRRIRTLSGAECRYTESAVMIRFMRGDLNTADSVVTALLDGMGECLTAEILGTDDAVGYIEQLDSRTWILDLSVSHPAEWINLLYIPKYTG